MEIYGPPKGVGTSGTPTRAAAGTDPALLALLNDLRSKVDSKEAEQKAAMQQEYALLMKTQREQASSMLNETVTILGQFQQLQDARNAEAAKDREARWQMMQQDQERRHEQALERERQFFQQTMQMTQQSANPQGSPLAQLQEMAQVVEVIKPLLGAAEPGGESLAQTVVKALPGVMDGLANGYERAASAAVEVRHQQRVARAGGPPAALPSPQAQPKEPVMAPPPISQAAPPTTSTRPRADDDEALTDVPEGANTEWMNSEEGMAFLGWLDYMDSIPIEKWQHAIMAGFQTDTLPSCMVTPIQSLIAGDQQPMVDLFEKAGALDMLQKAMEAFDASAGPEAVVEPPSGDGPRVDLEEGVVDFQAGLGPDSPHEAAGLEVPGSSGAAGHGNPDSPELSGPE
jgi:hypothetical protein